MKRSLTVTCPSPLDDAPVAVTHVSKLNGSSQPSIVMTTGGVLYVVKFWEFTGENGLMSEVIGSELMSRMGLPVPKWAPVLFTDAFLEKNPQLWYRHKTGSEGICPEAGPHFGSRLTLSKGENRTYEMIPGAWIDRVSNRQDFIGALLLDLWTNNCDRRQCVFISEADSKSFRAVFIDNDHMFGGHFGDEKTCSRRVMVPDERFYRGIWNESAVAHWKGVIDAIDDQFFDSLLAKVPEQWADFPQLLRVIDQLRLRRSKLGLLIAEAEETMANARLPSIQSPRFAGVIV